jgi:hypothetical protein
VTRRAKLDQVLSHLHSVSIYYLCCRAARLANITHMLFQSKLIITGAAGVFQHRPNPNQNRLRQLNFIHFLFRRILNSGNSSLEIRYCWSRSLHGDAFLFSCRVLFGRINFRAVLLLHVAGLADFHRF